MGHEILKRFQTSFPFGPSSLHLDNICPEELLCKTQELVIIDILHPALNIRRKFVLNLFPLCNFPDPVMGLSLDIGHMPVYFLNFEFFFLSEENVPRVLFNVINFEMDLLEIDLLFLVCKDQVHQVLEHDLHFPDRLPIFAVCSRKMHIIENGNPHLRGSPENLHVIECVSYCRSTCCKFCKIFPIEYLCLF